MDGLRSLAWSWSAAPSRARKVPEICLRRVYAAGHQHGPHGLPAAAAVSTWPAIPRRSTQRGVQGARKDPSGEQGRQPSTCSLTPTPAYTLSTRTRQPRLGQGGEHGTGPQASADSNRCACGLRAGEQGVRERSTLGSSRSARCGQAGEGVGRPQLGGSCRAAQCGQTLNGSECVHCRVKDGTVCRQGSRERSP